MSDYYGMLARNRFRVHLLRIPMVVLVGGCAAATSAMSAGQRAFLEKKIQAVEMENPPIFVVGHWRSGTTLLHEFLSLDPRFTYPTTFECFVPSHHLVSRSFLQPLMKLLLPGKRPMDSMPAGPDLPQEDEFALLGLGAPSPYFQIAFCKEAPPFLEMLNLNEASDEQIEALHQALNWFYKTITYKRNKRLVLKSPTHTGRIGHLAKWFPGAKFVHIARDPYKVFPSTIHLWQSLAEIQSYQFPGKQQPGLEDYVHRCYREMYEGYFSQIEQVPEKDRIELNFEDLVEDPIKQLERVYSQLGLDGFEDAKPKMETFWSQRKQHQKNETQLDEDTRSQIDSIWSEYQQRFGYRS